MRQFGLIGHPLSHSFSKKYFTEKFDKEGIAAVGYDNYPIASITELTSLLASVPALAGLNITIPYKEQVLPFLHNASPVVSTIKACNCIKITNGKLTGFNTDTVGFELSLKQYLAAHHTKALILGTGGAAKAVEYTLQKLGIQYRYVSRKVNEHALLYEANNARFTERVYAHY